MISNPFGRTLLTNGAASASGAEGAGATLCGARCVAEPPLLFCAATAGESAVSVVVRKETASAKTKRVRTYNFSFIKPSLIFTGGRSVAAHRQPAKPSLRPARDPICVRSFECDDNTPGCSVHNARHRASIADFRFQISN